MLTAKPQSFALLSLTRSLRLNELQRSEAKRRYEFLTQKRRGSTFDTRRIFSVLRCETPQVFGSQADNTCRTKSYFQIDLRDALGQ